MSIEPLRAYSSTLRAYSSTMAVDTRRRDDFDARLQALDLTIFETLGRPGWRRDARSLLALQAATRLQHETYSYLEIGSYLGASLQAHVADPRCAAVMSIDPRPESAPDDRWGAALFEENSTEHMLELLSGVPEAQLERLRTYEADASEVDPADLPSEPNLCFVDGEHTHRAALSDARFCRRVAADGAAIVFHDRAVVPTAIADFLDELTRDAVPFYAYALPSHLFVVELSDGALFKTAPVVAAAGRGRLLWTVSNRVGAARATRLLLRAESGARSVLPAWIKRPLASLVGRRSDADESVRAAPAGTAASGGD